MKLLLRNNIMDYLRLYIVLIVILNIECLKSQNAPVVQIVPVSPTAASLGQFGYIPVGYYTGTADISVPIYEIELDGKKFPINIAYHASGIKVAQEAGCVGLGWALQGYGSITKQVRGLDDFISSPIGYYFNTDFPVPTDGNYYDTQNGSISECKQYSILNMKDGEPDLFHFNFGPYSGTMFFQHKGIANNTSIKAYPLLVKVKDNLKVEYDVNWKTWKIVDGDGYIYYFNTYETTEFYQYTSNTNYQLSNISRKYILDAPREGLPDIITTWYLDSIVSPQKNKIRFEYDEDYIYTQKQRQETVYHLLEAYPNRYAGSMIHDLENYVYTCSKINQKILKKIATDLLTVEFVADDRLDIEPVRTSVKPRKVSEIRIKDKADIILKNVFFDYEYVGATVNYNNCRLFLKRITEKAGEEQHVYEFNYDRASLLPGKDSNAIDDWGYYNGMRSVNKKWGTQQQQVSSSDITYIPEYHLDIDSPLSGHTYDLKYIGRSREVSNEYIRCGILSSIKYPTGLNSYFEYEPHEVKNGNSSTIQKEQVVLAIAHYQNFLWDDEEENDKLAETSPERTFTLTEESKVTLYWKTYTDKKVEGYTSFYRCAFLKDSSGKILRALSIEANQLDLPLEETLSLSAGTYTIKIVAGNIEVPKGYDYGLTFSASRQVVKPTDVNMVAKGGGVRIKRIYSMFEGNKVSDQNYVYTDKGKSTGLLMNNPVFTYPFTIRSLCLLPGYATVVNVVGLYACGLSYPYTPFSFSAMGTPVGYSMVKVYDGLCAGHMEYSYFNVADIPLLGIELYMPGFPTAGSLNNGCLLSKVLYDDDNKKVEETKYYYMRDKVENVSAFKVHIPLVFLTLSINDFDYIYTKFYNTQSERSLLEREVTTSYANTGFSGYYGDVSRVIFNVYEYSPVNDFPSAVTSIGSDKLARQVQYKYATDYTDPISQKMQKYNLINKALETINLCDGLVTKAEKTCYFDTLGMVLPKTIYTLQLSSPLSLSMYDSYYRKKYSIDQYNKYGKIVQLSEKDNVPVTYLWGYKGTYPIAEIRNSTYDEVTEYIDDVYKLEQSLMPAMAPVENLRTILKKSLISTYTYKIPWGVEKVVSPTGMKTIYNYDPFGRLQTVLDHDGNIIQRFKYNYKQ